MNFTVEKALTSGGRLGRLTQKMSTAGASVSVETPMSTLYTKGGSAPYLGLNMLEKIKHVPEVVTMSMNSFVDHIDNIKEHGKGIGEFSSMKGKLIFSSLHDASLPMPLGKNERSGVAVWGKGGKRMLNASQYVSMQEALQADWLMALSDGDTDKDSTEKRAGKAVDRTLDFLDDVIAAREKSQTLRRSSLIGVVVGGFSDNHRLRSAKETAARPVEGFLIEGFQKGNTGENMLDCESFQNILLKTLSLLPDNKPRLMQSAWSPLQVLQAFAMGIDIFSSVYPHLLGEKGQAMVEDFSLPPSSQTARLEKENGDTDCAASVIDLKHKRYFEDFGPVLQGCQCYTCATFSRSYIHHLLNTSELLAHVLLTIHNFERYFLFFDSLRNAIRNDRLEELKEKLSQHKQVVES